MGEIGIAELPGRWAEIVVVGVGGVRNVVVWILGGGVLWRWLCLTFVVEYRPSHVPKGTHPRSIILNIAPTRLRKRFAFVIPSFTRNNFPFVVIISSGCVGWTAGDKVVVVGREVKFAVGRRKGFCFGGGHHIGRRGSCWAWACLGVDIELTVGIDIRRLTTFVIEQRPSHGPTSTRSRSITLIATPTRIRKGFALVIPSLVRDYFARGIFPGRSGGVARCTFWKKVSRRR